MTGCCLLVVLHHFAGAHKYVTCYAGLEDPITCVLAALQSEDVQAMLTLMSSHVPRTLEALLLHALSPAAAELLTQKLEQLDLIGTLLSSAAVTLCHPFVAY